MPVNATILPLANFAFGTTSPTNPLPPVRTGERGLGSERTAAGKRAVLTIARQTNGAGANPVVTGTVAVWGADLPNPVAGTPLGNAYASSVSPASFTFIGDGSTATVQTDIPYVAFSNNNFICETQAFKISGTFAVATTGVATGTSGVASQTKLGDQIIIGGFPTFITAYTDQDTFTVTPAPGVAITAGAVAINVSADRRMKTHAGTIGSTNPELFNITSGATINGVACALVTFAIAPAKNVGPSTASTYVTGGPVAPNCIYFVTPKQIKAAASFGTFDRSGVRAYSAMWVVPAAVTSELCATSVTLEHAAD